MKVTIVGKKNCSKCSTIKSILENKGVDCDYFDVESDKGRHFKERILKENKGMYPLLLDEEGKVIDLKYILGRI